MKNRFIVAAGLMAGTTLMLAAAPAMARVDVELNIGVPTYYGRPAPVYVQPHPTYIQPRPVYVERQPYYVQPQPYYVDRHYRDEWRERHWRGRHGRGYDVDRDGVPNRYDRDRDGDGVPNRYDRRPDNPYRN